MLLHSLVVLGSSCLVWILLLVGQMDSGLQLCRFAMSQVKKSVIVKNFEASFWNCSGHLTASLKTCLFSLVYELNTVNRDAEVKLLN